MKNFRIISIAMLIVVLLMGLTVSAYSQDKVKVKKTEKAVAETKEECCEGLKDKCAGCTVKAEVKGTESEHVCTEACKEACAKAKLPEGHPKMKEGATAGHEHADHATEVHGAACKDKHAEGECCEKQKEKTEKEKK